jgi:uracil-DNA glycosylase
MKPEHMKIMFAGLTEITKTTIVGPLSKLLSSTIVSLNADILRECPTDPLNILTPRPGLIFEAFRKCPVENIRVVIIGQDPYIKPGEAMGMSFSVPSGFTVPPSLRNIYKCLQHNKLITTIPTSGDLTAWAAQGVLLLNSALTTRLRVSNAHADIWKKYTDEVIRTLSGINRQIIFVLFGGFAQEKRSLIDIGRHLVFEWGHPSNLNRVNGDTMNPKNFTYCNVFNRINDHLSLHGGLPINWNPLAEPPVMTPLGPRELNDEFCREHMNIGVATSSAVTRIQTHTTMVTLTDYDTTEGGYEVTDGIFTGMYDSALTPTVTPATTHTPAVTPALIPVTTQQPTVTPATTQQPEPLSIGVTAQNAPYVIREWTDQDPQCYTSETLWVVTDGGSKDNGKPTCIAAYGWYMTDGEKIAFSTGIVPESTLAGVVYRASNNRGELMAILSAIEFVVTHCDSFNFSSIIVVSDSEYSIKSITIWIYTWLKDLEKHADKKNLDLIGKAKDIVEELKKKYKVSFRHINSHQNEPDDKDCEDWFMWKCNDIVDRLCNKTLGRKGY